MCGETMRVLQPQDTSKRQPVARREKAARASQRVYLRRRAMMRPASPRPSSPSMPGSGTLSLSRHSWPISQKVPSLKCSAKAGKERPPTMVTAATTLPMDEIRIPTTLLMLLLQLTIPSEAKIRPVETCWNFKCLQINHIAIVKNSDTWWKSVNHKYGVDGGYGNYG